MFLEKKFVFQSEISTYSLILFSKNIEILSDNELFKVNQIDIPDYQYYVGCNAKRMVRLTFLEKKFVFQSEISTYSLILFSKNSEILSDKELFKVNQIDIPDYQYYVGCNVKKMVCLMFLEKKFVFQSEISTYSLILFSKNIEILSDNELFKVNQIDIPDYQYYVGCNAKRMVRLTFLEKKFVFQSEISTYSLILFSKNSEILSDKELFKVNQIDIPDYQYYVGCNAKRMVCLMFLEKKFVFQSEISTYSPILFSKNSEILLNQGVVQSEPN